MTHQKFEQVKDRKDKMDLELYKRKVFLTQKRQVL